MKFYEVTNYMIKADQLMFVCTVASNAKFYAGLPANIKKIVDEAIAGATSYIFDYQHQLNQKRKAMILKKKPSMKYYELTAKEKAAFEKKAMSVRQKYVEIGGPGAKKILDTLVKEIAAAENQPGA